MEYQTLVCMLFTHYAPLACIEYDRHFRQAADQDTSIRWDCLKEDIFVWAITRPSHTHPAKSGLTTLCVSLFIILTKPGFPGCQKVCNLGYTWAPLPPLHSELHWAPLPPLHS